MQASLHHTACDVWGCRSPWKAEGETRAADTCLRELMEQLGGENALASDSIKRFSRAVL